MSELDQVRRTAQIMDIAFDIMNKPEPRCDKCGSPGEFRGGMLQQRYLRIGASALVAPQASTVPLAVDPTPGDPWDGTTGVALRTFALPASSVAVRHRVIASLTPPEGMQAALTVGINADGATPVASNTRTSPVRPTPDATTVSSRPSPSRSPRPA